MLTPRCAGIFVGRSLLRILSVLPSQTMDDAAISAVVAEIAPLIIGRAPGKIFQFGPRSLAVDFGLRHHGYLLISVEPATPRLYLVRRRVRDLEKNATRLTHFSLNLRKQLAQTTVSSFEKLPNDRVVVMEFVGSNELGQRVQRTLVAQLTGRSANLFLLDDKGVIIAALKESQGAGQATGEKYEQPKTTQHPAGRSQATPFPFSDGSISQQLDQHYTSLEARRESDSHLAAARAQLNREISRRNKLIKQLESDLAEHSDAEQHKRIGDLLLANVGTAKRAGGWITLRDYFAEGAPEIELELDEKLTIPEEASRRFELFARSKRARVKIANRIERVKDELAELRVKREQLEKSPDTFDAAPFGSKLKTKPSGAKSRETRVPGARRYVSSEGYEILVGRAARDNDNLTFKVAKPNDLWLHAADYPGSHVIVRNPTRKDIPTRTLFEAAQLAAYFSQASKDPKVNVHYTQRKFLVKPKGAAAGLVRMSRFKNLLVAPAEPAQRF